jgi:hypothetical protein
MREKGQVIEGNGVKGVRFAELASSQFQIAGLGGYGGDLSRQFPSLVFPCGPIGVSPRINDVLFDVSGNGRELRVFVSFGF